MKYWDERILFWSRTRAAEKVFADPRTSIDFQELESVTATLVKTLHSHGINSHDRVLIALPRSTAKAICVSALLRAEIAGLSIERTEVAQTIDSTVRTLQPHALIVLQADEQIATANLARARCYSIDLGSANDPLRQLSLVVIDQAERIASPRDLAWLLQTSGSTGRPSIVMIGRQNLQTRAEREVEDFKIISADRLMNSLSFSHDLGLNQLLSTLVSGCSLRIQNQPFASSLAKEIRENKPTGMTGTPLMWSRVLDQGPHTFPSLRYVTVSGGALSAEKLKLLQSTAPNALILRTYGQTETFRTFIGVGIESSPRGAPIKGVRVQLIKPNGESCPLGENGELVHFGDGAMMGYFNDEAASDSKRFGAGIRTGDLFSEVSSNEFIYAGRSDDMIKRFEHRLHLGEVEMALRSIDGVQEACVLSQPSAEDDIRQNLLAAFVETKSDSKIDVDLIMRSCKMILPSHQVPDEVHILKTLPRTVSFKLDRQMLRKRWINS